MNKHALTTIAPLPGSGGGCMARLAPEVSTRIGCPECAWGKVAGCWHCGSRAFDAQAGGYPVLPVARVKGACPRCDGAGAGSCYVCTPRVVGIFGLMAKAHEVTPETRWAINGREVTREEYLAWERARCSGPAPTSDPRRMQLLQRDGLMGL